MKTGIVGSGGRENTLEETFLRSPSVSEVVRLTGGFEHMLEQALQAGVELIVVGPERPLVEGFVDFFAKKVPQIKVFGPNALAAELEGSKIFMKTRCRRWGIATADFDFAGAYSVAERSIKRTGFRIIKADGLCDGKGVFVTKDQEAALAGARELLERGKIVIEEKLTGVECSIMTLCDGVEARMLLPARDYKRLSADSDKMTGGMGAYSPLPDMSDEILPRIQTEIVDKLVQGMAKEGRPYHGVLYAGIMLTKDGPMLLEVNCRFGDPETQTVLARLDSDIVPYLVACTEYGGLSQMPPLQWMSLATVCVCYASKGYPDVGRRLGYVLGFGATVALAREDAYRKLALIPGIKDMEWRDDIAAGV